MKIHATSFSFHHFFPRCEEHVKVLQTRDEDNRVIKTEVIKFVLYNKKGQIVDVSYGSQYNLSV